MVAWVMVTAALPDRYNYTHEITNDNLEGPRRISITFRMPKLTH